jgi:hypothetical protein
MQQAVRSHADALLEAGLRLSRRTPLARLTTAVVATEAGLPSLRFFDAYPGLLEYLVDLYQRHFLLPVRQQVLEILARLPPGLERTRTATQAYLDYCLKHRGLRRWTIEARIWPAFNDAYNNASQGFQLLAEDELRSMGFSDTAGAARLFAALVYEIASVEVHDGHENPGLRQSLWRLLAFSDRPVLRFAPRAAVDDPLPRTVTATPHQRLLRAGEQLLRDKGRPDALQIEPLLARANVDREGFNASFGDLEVFQLALIQSWTEQFMARCLSATQGLPPGTERLHAFMAAAWDYNLNEQRGLRLLMKAMLRTDAELSARIVSRVQSYTRMVAAEFQALDVPSPQAMARLFIAASTELVESEELANAALPQLRETFWQLFDPLTAGVRASTRRGRRLRVTDEAVQTSFLSMQLGGVPAGGRRPRRSPETMAALRQRLVEAGDRLLLSGAPLDTLTPNRLALVAGVEDAEFEAVYPDFRAYLTDLMTFLLDGVRDIALEVTARMGPGIPRIWQGIEVYLDGRLDRPAIHELARGLQGYAAAVRLSRARSRAFARIFTAEFSVVGRADAEENGHLLVALVNETVQAEYEAGRRLPEYRATLHAFLARG